MFELYLSKFKYTK